MSHMSLWDKVGSIYGEIAWAPPKQNKKKHKEEIHTYIKHGQAQLLGSFRSVSADSQTVDLTLAQLAGLPWDWDPLFSRPHCLQHRSRRVVCHVLWLRIAALTHTTQLEIRFREATFLWKTSCPGRSCRYRKPDNCVRPSGWDWAHNIGSEGIWALISMVFYLQGELVLRKSNNKSCLLFEFGAFLRCWSSLCVHFIKSGDVFWTAC